jgi:hypothetical protein
MEELLSKARYIVNNQDIKVLKERLHSYNPQVNNIEWDESKTLGELRMALHIHINTTISKASFDLENFINHFK